jgi:arginine decarboxylase
LIAPTYNEEYDFFHPVTTEQIELAIKEDPSIQVVYITSPNYEGQVADISEIRKVIGDRLLFVDEAHGAHLYFSSKLPQGSLFCGADVAVASTYKTIVTLASTAIINLSKDSRISVDQVLDAYSMFNATAANSLLSANIESQVKFYSDKGEELI